MYNKHTNIVDLASAEFVSVMAYLKANGVPEPSDIDVQQVSIPTGERYTNKTLRWHGFGRPDPFEIDAYMVMNWPSWTVRWFRQWADLPPYGVPEYEPPKPPAPKPNEPQKPKLAHEGEPGYVKRSNGFFVWWERAQ
jgi:hypothetical protein